MGLETVQEDTSRESSDTDRPVRGPFDCGISSEG